LSLELKKRVDVLLLAAGFGKRLRPLTDTVPKPLVEVQGRPLIEWNFDLLKEAGLERVFVNTHHLANRMVEYFDSRPKDGLQISLVHETPEILDTGGAINNLYGKLEGDLLLCIEATFEHVASRRS